MAIEDDNEISIAYAKPEKAQEVFDMLCEVLSVMHPELVGLHDGFYVDNSILHLKRCEVWVKQI